MNNKKKSDKNHSYGPTNTLYRWNSVQWILAGLNIAFNEPDVNVFTSDDVLLNWVLILSERPLLIYSVILLYIRTESLTVMCIWVAELVAFWSVSRRSRLEPRACWHYLWGACPFESNSVGSFVIQRWSSVKSLKGEISSGATRLVVMGHPLVEPSVVYLVSSCLSLKLIIIIIFFFNLK